MEELNMSKVLGVVDFQGYTAKDLVTGRFLSKSQAGKKVKDKIVQIFCTKPISSQTIDTRLGIGSVPKSAEESAKVFIENGYGAVSKNTRFLKKLAKFGFVGLGIAGAIGVGLFLLNKCSRKKSDSSQMEVRHKKPEVTGDKKAENIPEKEDYNYIVKKGDSLWKIAEKYLIEQHKNDPNYKPTNRDILEMTEKLMKINNKDYQKPLPADSRKRKVSIYPGEILKLA